MNIIKNNWGINSKKKSNGLESFKLLIPFNKIPYIFNLLNIFLLGFLKYNTIIFLLYN